MDTLRKPFLVVALVLMLLVVLLETGGVAVLRGVTTPTGSLADRLPAGDAKTAFEKMDATQREELANLANQASPPGMAIAYLALLDGLVLFTVALIGAGVLIPSRIHGRIQGVATLVFSILLILAAIVLVLAAFALVILMVSLLLAIPFGTLIYLVKFGFFNRGGASVLLSLVMLLKLGFAGSLVLAQQRFLQNWGLVLLILTSLVANIVISFLHGLTPLFLVSLTDGVAAIIVAIAAIIWAAFFLIGSLMSVVRAVNVRA